MSFNRFIQQVTHRFTAFRVTKEEFDFVDTLAREKGLTGKGPAKGHSIVIREAIALLKEKTEKEAKKASRKQEIES